MILDELDQGEPTTGKNAGFPRFENFFRHFNSVGHDDSIETKNIKIRS